MKKILIICDHKQRDFKHLSLLAYFLKKNEFEIKIITANFEFYYQLLSFQPQFVILGNSNQRWNIQMAQFAKKCDAKIVILNSEGNYNINRQIVRFGKKINNFVDIYLAWGKQHQQDLLVNTDIDKNKVFISGSPKFDLYHPQILKNYQKANLQKYFKNNKPIICLASSFGFAESKYESAKNNMEHLLESKKEYNQKIVMHLKMRLDFIDLAKKLDRLNKFNIIFRPHPNSDINYFKVRLKNTRIFLDKNLPVAKLLTNIDLLIHRNSTLSTESWILGKPTLSYDPIKNLDNEMIASNQTEKVFHRQQELINFLGKYNFKKIKISPQQKAFLRNWYNYDFKNKKRIFSKQIAEILKKQNISKFKFNFHYYLIIHLILYILKIILRKKYAYQVLALFWGQKYLQLVKSNYIKSNQVERMLRVYQQIFV